MKNCRKLWGQAGYNNYYMQHTTNLLGSQLLYFSRNSWDKNDYSSIPKAVNKRGGT